MIFTRWDPMLPLSPWNCILLTKHEAGIHDKNVFSYFFEYIDGLASSLSNGDGLEKYIPYRCVAEKLYSSSFVQGIKGRHLVARHYFKGLLSVEKLHFATFGIKPRHTSASKKNVRFPKMSQPNSGKSDGSNTFSFISEADDRVSSSEGPSRKSTGRTNSKRSTPKQDKETESAILLQSQMRKFLAKKKVNEMKTVNR